MFTSTGAGTGTGARGAAARCSRTRVFQACACSVARVAKLSKNSPRSSSAIGPSAADSTWARSHMDDSGAWMTVTSASRRASGSAERLSSASCRPSHWVAAVWLVSRSDSTLPRSATGSVTASACTESPAAGTVRRGTPGCVGTWRFTPRGGNGLGCRPAASLPLVGRPP